MPRTARRERRHCPPKQPQTRLNREDVTQLVAAYQAGARVKQLAEQFGIHRLTVSSILQREGVRLRPGGIHPDDLPEVIRLYQDGWALARLAVQVRRVTQHRDQHPAPGSRAYQTTGTTPDQRVGSFLHGGC